MVTHTLVRYIQPHTNTWSIYNHICTRWYNNEKQDWWILDGHKMECALIINVLVLLPKRQKLTKRIILFFTFSYNHNVDTYHNILVVVTLALALPSVAPWLTCCFKIFNGSCWVEVIPRGGIFRRIWWILCFCANVIGKNIYTNLNQWNHYVTCLSQSSNQSSKPWRGAIYAHGNWIEVINDIAYIIHTKEVWK